MTQQVLYDTATSRVLQWQDTSKFNYAPPTSTQAVLSVTAAEWADQSGAWYVVDGALTQTNPKAPTAAQLLAQAQSAQTATLRQSYKQAIATAPVVVNGTDYTLATDAATQLSAYLSAQQALASPAWAANTAVTEGQIVTVSGTPLFCSTAGTTGSSAPTAPTEIGTPVTDGTAAWELFARSAETSAGTFVWFTAAEIVSVAQQIELYLHQQKSTLIKLLAEVQAATTVTDVQSIVWP